MDSTVKRHSGKFMGMTENKTLSPEELIQRIKVVDVDSLSFWEDNPNQGDIGAIDKSMEAFGQLDVIVIRDGGVVSGEHRVRREMSSRQFDGRLAALDISDLDWDDYTTIAAALALNRTSRLGHDDPGAMIGVLRILQDHDEGALMEAASWDDEDIRALQIQLHAELDLEKVSERLHSQASDENFLVMKLDEETMALWLQYKRDNQIEEDTEALLSLLEESDSEIPDGGTR